MSVCVRAFLHVCVGVWVNNNLSLVPNTCRSATCECGCQGWCVYVLRETETVTGSKSQAYQRQVIKSCLHFGLSLPPLAV